MPNVAHTGRMTWRGHIANVQSCSFSFGFSYHVNGAGAADPSAADVAAGLAGSAALHGYESDFIAALAPLMSPLVTFSSVAYSVFGEDPAVPAVSEFQAANQGGGAVRLPGEVAVVASLRTALTTRSGRGRMYLPMLGADPDAGGQLSPAYQATIAGAVGAYFNSIDGHIFQTSGGIDYGVTVGVISTTHGVFTPVNRVVVDSHYDSQRRREDKLPLTSHSVVVTP